MERRERVREEIEESERTSLFHLAGTLMSYLVTEASQR